MTPADPITLRHSLLWKPRKVFVNSMSDLFHADVPDEFIARVWAVMALSPRHTFQVLTKRHGRVRSLLSNARFRADVEREMCRLEGEDGGLPADEWPLPNVWLGVSVEDQQRADLRIPALLDTPAAVRFLSCEPLLGPIDLARWTRPHTLRCRNEMMSPPWCTCGRDDDGYLAWVIVGGESGPGARPMHPDWARSLRDQCVSAGVPFHYKQHGEWVPESALMHRDDAPAAFLATDGTARPLVNGKPLRPPMARGQDITVRRVGKHRAGRMLDGRTWDEYPEAVGSR